MGARTRGCAAGPLGPDAGIRFDARLEGRLRRRYKRFFAEVETGDGGVLTAHCPNPGSMRGCALPGARVRCSESANPARSLRHTLEMIEIGSTWVGLHTGRANALARAALLAGLLPELADHTELRAEVKADSRSRLDFQLRDPGSGGLPVWLEVKSVTLAEGELALFPDSVTERGRRHLETLMRLRSAGDRAALLFLVQRSDCARVAPADDIDPAYGEALRRAAAAGVELYALGARVGAGGIRVERRLPVVL